MLSRENFNEPGVCLLGIDDESSNEPRRDESELLTEGAVLWRMQEARSNERMENVLVEVYQRPYDSKRPVICVDEKPVALFSDATPRLPPRGPGHVLLTSRTSCVSCTSCRTPPVFRIAGLSCANTSVRRARQR